MALSFIWKKQLVWFITLIFVVILGLTIGAFLHDIVQDQRDGDVGAVGTGSGKTSEVRVAVPSLPYPTVKPGVGVGAPSGNPPSAGERGN